MLYNRIPITIGQFQLITGPTVSYQYDIEQYLVFNSVTLPDYYTVDFCNVGDSQTVTITGTPDGVRIPDELLLTGRDIKAYVVLTGTDEGAVETRYEITLPVRNRPMRQGVEPTPEERLEIETLVNALNDGVTRAEDAATEAEGQADRAETAADNAQSAVEHYPKIEDGYWYVWLNGGWVNTGTKAEGVDGKGIVSVTGQKTSTSGLVDTYTLTVTYTDSTTDTITFTVTNGRDGTDGTDGVSPGVTITDITGGHRVTITDKNHPTGQSFDVLDGEITQADLDTAVESLNQQITGIENTLISEAILSDTQKSWTRQSGGTAYENLYYPQQFESGKTYKISIKYVSADTLAFYCGTSVAASTSGGFVDGGNITDSVWKLDTYENTGFTRVIQFTATGDASYFRFRCTSTVTNFENKIEVAVYEISNSIEVLTNDVAGLKPKYDDTVVNGINTVLGLNSQNRYFNLFFMTDTHADVWDATGAFHAANIANKTKAVDAFVHGGDFVANSYDSVGLYNNAVSKIRINDFVNQNILVVKGNHENYATSEKNSQFVLMFQNFENTVVNSADPDGGYFYIDYPKTKTRVIVLNTWYDATSSTETLGNYQLAWLYQTALGTIESNYTVLVFAHNIVNNSDSTVDTNILLSLRNLLHAFADKGTTYGDYYFSPDAHGELAAVIVGHQHTDAYSNTSGFNKIVVTRASSVDDDGFAVDIFTIDTDNHILYETRIGRGNSRAFNYGATNSQIP